MDEKKVALVEKAMKDEEFVKKIAAAITPEEAQAVFASRGIDFTIDEVKAIAAGIKSDVGELDEDDLENVSGGIAITTVATIVGIVATGVKVIDTVRKWRW